MSARTWLGVLLVVSFVVGFSWLAVREVGWVEMVKTWALWVALVAFAVAVAWCFA